MRQAKRENGLQILLGKKNITLHILRHTMKNMLDSEGKEIPAYIRKDIIGKKFGKVTVLEFDSIRDRRSYWKCLCDCGGICFISRKVLTRDEEKRTYISCGCIPKKSGRLGSRSLSDQFAVKLESLLKHKKVVGDCWEWTGAYSSVGVPWCSWNSKAMCARRCMYMVINFLTETDNIVYSSCGNKKCINPDHLTINAPKRSNYKK